MRSVKNAILLAAGVLAGAGVPAVFAQQVTGTLGLPSATTTVSPAQLPAPDPKFGGRDQGRRAAVEGLVGATHRAATGAPNVLLVITDDAGFACRARSAGSSRHPRWIASRARACATNRMFSTALCSPTRAALITGRNHHSVGFGVISEQSTGFPATTASSPRTRRRSAACWSTTAMPPHGSARTITYRPCRQPGGAFRPVAVGHGLRVLLRLRGRRRQPVAAEPVPHTTQIYPFQGKPGWKPGHRHGGRRIDYMTRIPPDTARQADLHQVRAGRDARTASPHQGVGGQDPRRCTSLTTATRSCASASSRTRRSSAWCRRTRSSRRGRATC